VNKKRFIGKSVKGTQHYKTSQQLKVLKQIIFKDFINFHLLWDTLYVT